VLHREWPLIADSVEKLGAMRALDFSRFHFEKGERLRMLRGRL
jgi:hypothetical protein